MSDSIRVLHVDDEPGFADMTAQYLKRQDDRFDVTVEMNARACLDRLADGEDLDCIVSDYDMPEMDGIELLDRVRAEYPDLPFVLFTGKGSEEVASDAISAGATDYLQKEVGTDQYAVLANRVTNAVEKQQSQRALADRTSRLEALKTFNEELLENVPVGLFRVDDEFRVTYVNPRAEEIFGVPEDADESASIGRDVRELPSVTAAGQSETLSRLADGERIEFEIPFVSMYGEESHLFVKGVPLFDDGAFDGGIIMLEDVTERKEHERALEQRRERLRILFDEAPDTIVVHDGEGTITDVNETATDQLGYTREELLSMDVPDIQVDVTPEQAAELLDQAESESYIKVEGRYRRKDGSTFPVDVWVNPIEFEGEERFLAIARDITERKEYERELRDERDRFRALFRNTSDCIAEVNMESGDTIVERVNPAFEEVFGFDADEVVGEQLDDLVTPASVWDEAIDFNRRAREGEAVRREVSRKTDVGLREFLHRSVPYTVADERRGHAVYTDITDRKEKERELQRQNERLENVLSILSHDLRNPLNVAIGHLELSLANRDDEDLATATDALERMDTIIDTTLTFARQGQVVTDEKTVDVRPLVDQCWDVIETSDAVLEVVDDFEIRASPNRLSHLFENLFHNAVVHGSEDVTIRVGSTENGFYVEDDGPGISEDEREEVFEAGHSTTDDGSGFGLAIVEQIIEAHGWEIDVTDGDDCGAQFEITGVDVRR